VPFGGRGAQLLGPKVAMPQRIPNPDYQERGGCTTEPNSPHKPNQAITPPPHSGLVLYLCKMGLKNNYKSLCLAPGYPGPVFAKYGILLPSTGLAVVAKCGLLLPSTAPTVLQPLRFPR
jgi:hypothetical protein